MPPTENSAALFGWHSQDSRATGPLDTADTVTAHYGTGGGNTPLIVQPCICIQGSMIGRGEKREEYREATEYYQTRINSAIAADPNCKGQAYKIFPVKIRAGYNSKAPAAVLRVHCIFGKGGVREWGADPDKYYYILQILHIESIENWKGGNV